MCSRVVVAVSAFTELSVNVFTCGGGSVSVCKEDGRLPQSVGCRPQGHRPCVPAGEGEGRRGPHPHRTPQTGTPLVNGIPRMSRIRQNVSIQRKKM